MSQERCGSIPNLHTVDDEPLRKLIEQLTTSGREELDTKGLKTLILQIQDKPNLCFQMVFRQLEVDHAQVRYSALILLNELIEHSNSVRKLFLLNHQLLSAFIKLTVQLTTQKPKKGRPKPLRPHTVATKLKSRALRLLVGWNCDMNNKGQLGKAPSGSKALARTLRFISKDLQIPLPEARPSSPVEPLLNSASSKIALDILLREVDYSEPDIIRTLSEIRTCFELIIPKFEPEQRFCEEDNSHTQQTTSTVQFTFASNGPITIVKDQDNETILDNLSGLYKIITNRFVPMVLNWITTGDDNEIEQFNPSLEQRLEQLKGNLSFEKSRYERIQFINGHDHTSESESDSDFEEVRTVPEWTQLPCFAPSPPPSNSPLTSTSSTITCTTNLAQNTIPHTFESCGAPLPGGTLCSRRDLLKCPFHGKIIRRDELGYPVDEGDMEYERKRLQKVQAQDHWQDPAFLTKLKLKTGMDLTIKKGRRGHSFEGRFPGLIPLKSTSTSRKRLHKLVLGRSSKQPKLDIDP